MNKNNKLIKNNIIFYKMIIKINAIKFINFPNKFKLFQKIY